MPRGYGGNTDMLEYLSRRYNRGDQMRELLNTFSMMKQLQEKRAESERERGFKERGQLEP